MKKNLLSLAVAAGLTGVAATATAQMHINDKGLGEALIFPYYSAENGNDTYIHIVNTTADSKAVKVRILEGKNSSEVLDFNLYMSPEDHFSFVITETADGEGAMLRTGDNSCTAPAIPADGVEFVNFKYSGDSDKGLGRTKVGYVEVIEMGQIADGSPVDVDITHNSSGVAACKEVIAQWSTGGDWFDGDLGHDFQSTWNGGGLYGISTVVNPEDAFAVGVDAVAIDDFASGSGWVLHRSPGSVEPNFLSTGVNTSAVIFDEGGAVTLNFAGADAALNRIDAVNSLFMTATLANDFVLDDDRLSATDWVITMPTKAPHVNAATAREPFDNIWDKTKSQACEPFAVSLWNREEANVTITEGPVFSPRPTTTTPDDFQFCYESGVLQMGARPALGAVAGSTVVDLSDNIEYAEGWARLSFVPADLNTPADVGTRTVSDGTTTLTGLPVTGFAVTKLYNSQAKEGVEAFYATAFNHKSTVAVSAPAN